MTVTITGVTDIGAVTSDTDLVAEIHDACQRVRWPDGSVGIIDGDIIVVTSKIVSKAEGRVVATDDRHQVIASETARVVARTANGETTIVQTHHGFVMAAAGVDNSNTDIGTVVLLPRDPDASASAIRSAFTQRVAVVITDTFGRPWREGVTDAAIGCAGLVVLDDHRGTIDTHGNPLNATIVAIADEIAAAADLVKGKLNDIPVAIIRGLDAFVSNTTATGQDLIRPESHDLFTLGTAEAIAHGRQTAVAQRRTIRTFTDQQIEPHLIEQMIAAAVTAPAPHHTSPWRFIVLKDQPSRTRLLDAMEQQWRADLAGIDGLTESAIAARIVKGRILRTAPVLIAAFVDLTDAHTYPDARRASAERDMFIAAGGAAASNAMVTASAHSLATAWVSSTFFCADVVRNALDLPAQLQPIGMIAVGYPAATPPERSMVDLSDYVIER